MTVQRWKAICQFLENGDDAGIPVAVMIESHEGFVAGQDYDALAAQAKEIERLRGLLREALPFVRNCEWDYCDGRSCQALAARIDAALAADNSPEQR